MKKDIEKYINDNIKAQTPPSLSKENIEKMIDGFPQEAKLPKRKRVQTVYKFAAVAAAVALVISGISLYGSVKKPKTPTVVNNGTVSIPSEENYDEIYARLKAIKASYNFESGNGRFEAFGSALPGATFDQAQEGSVNSENASSKEQYGTTNTQEENIDEGDIIKTDGKNIYIADRQNDRVYIVKADSGKMSKLSEIKLSGEVHIQEMYLTENTLAVVYSEYDYSKQPKGYSAVYSISDTVYKCGCCVSWVYADTKISFYDVSDPVNVKLISDYSQSGDFTSSRLRNGKIYLVSSYGVNLFADDYKKTCIPETAENGVKERIPASKITLVNGTQTPAYAVICAFDTKTAEKSDSSAIFGDPTHVYATENSFYLVETRYDSDKAGSFLNILKFEFTETGVKYLTSAKADGYINSNLSMSEYGGYFRIATTCQLLKTLKRSNGKGETVAYDGEINKLYIFNEKMEQEGIIDGFAKNEQIRSARYIGNYAYIVTFRQTDPLFIINLSDPKNPVIESELKLPGFSSYLHPIGEGMLIGIGNDGDENNANGNMKVSLFSVADPKNPKELTSVKVGNEKDFIVSDMSYSYKAFISLPDGRFAVPFSINNEKTVFICYSVNGSNVAETARYELGNASFMIEGGTYIGNYFYAFSSEFIDSWKSEDVVWKARLTSFDMTSNAKTQEIEL